MRNHLAISVLGVALSLGSGVACGAFDSFGGNESATFGSGGSTGYGGGFDDTVSAGPGGASASYNFSELCGDTCIPGTDEHMSCDLPAGTGANGGAGGHGGQLGGAGGTGGAGGSGAAGGAGGEGAGSAPGGAGGDAFGGNGGAPPDTLAQDCRLGVSSRGDVAGMCIETDTSAEVSVGTACLVSSDCGAGQGCVTIGENRQCRPYCCGEVEQCPDQTYCAEAPLSAGDVPMGIELPKIPVCVAADFCELGEDCMDTAKTCTVVRLTGQVTSCVEPGDGLIDAPCPCAAGHFCDSELNQCLKFCRLNVENACPPDFSCQGGSSAVPEGFGTCVATN